MISTKLPEDGGHFAAPSSGLGGYVSKITRTMPQIVSKVFPTA